MQANFEPTRFAAAVGVQARTFLDASISGFPGLLKEFLIPANNLLHGGKRGRAQWCAAGFFAAKNEISEAGALLIQAGAALELYQLSALIHDDIIDRASTRRGISAAHISFSNSHIENKWHSDASHFGTGAAILLGDLLTSLSFSQLDQALTHARADLAPKARAVLTSLVNEVALGQYLDFRAEQPGPHTDFPLHQALETIRHKSANYSVVLPATLGAVLGGAQEETLRALTDFTVPLGEAFQLRDDDLGVFGNPQLTGKPAGEDLREGKRTALVALALEMTCPADKEHLCSQLGNANMSPQQVGELQEIFIRCGARNAHEELITSRLKQSDFALTKLQLAPSVADFLHTLGAQTVLRQS